MVVGFHFLSHSPHFVPPSYSTSHTFPLPLSSLQAACGPDSGSLDVHVALAGLLESNGPWSDNPQAGTLHGAFSPGLSSHHHQHHDHHHNRLTFGELASWAAPGGIGDEADFSLDCFDLCAPAPGGDRAPGSRAAEPAGALAAGAAAAAAAAGGGAGGVGPADALPRMPREGGGVGRAAAAEDEAGPAQQRGSSHLEVGSSAMMMEVASPSPSRHPPLHPLAARGFGSGQQSQLGHQPQSHHVEMKGGHAAMQGTQREDQQLDADLAKAFLSFRGLRDTANHPSHLDQQQQADPHKALASRHPWALAAAAAASSSVAAGAAAGIAPLAIGSEGGMPAGSFGVGRLQMGARALSSTGEANGGRGEGDPEGSGRMAQHHFHPLHHHHHLMHHRELVAAGASLGGPEGGLEDMEGLSGMGPMGEDSYGGASPSPLLLQLLGGLGGSSQTPPPIALMMLQPPDSATNDFSEFADRFLRGDALALHDEDEDPLGALPGGGGGGGAAKNRGAGEPGAGGAEEGSECGFGFAQGLFHDPFA
jgi:hypothetical protein